MKIVKLTVASVAPTLTPSFMAFAGTWRQSESRPDAWWYDYGDGQYPSNTWVWLDGNKDDIAGCYYLDKGGWLLTDTMTPDGYQANADGQWITYGQIRRVYSTATTREAMRTVNDKAYRPREATCNYSKDDSFGGDTGKRVSGPESSFTQRTFWFGAEVGECASVDARFFVYQHGTETTAERRTED